MIPGYNHNIKYKDRIYHVQTEDSGVENPHIITHLFYGGNIIHSIKTSYADIVQNLNFAERLVELMQLQHKNVLKDLIKGRYDDDIAVRSVNAATLKGPAPLNVEAGGQHRVSLGFGGGLPSKPAGASDSPSAAKEVAAASPSTASPAAAVSAAGAPSAEAAPASSFFGSAPPAKVIEASALQAAFEANDLKAVDSIFGNLISEKSLDEVILSYLADDTKQRE